MIHNETTGQELATDVRTARGLFGRTIGVIAAQPLSDGFAMVFKWDTVGERGIHMLFVREALDVLWLREDTVLSAQTLEPWIGHHVWPADTVIELPAGGALKTERGDKLTIELDP